MVLDLRENTQIYVKKRKLNYSFHLNISVELIIFSCIIPLVLYAIRERVGYVKTQLSCILLYYADDDMFRPLWAIFRSQKCI